MAQFVCLYLFAIAVNNKYDFSTETSTKSGVNKSFLLLI